ncbi:outer membrane lipoprotein-sorting protein [Ancylomarina subtilis]|uniref:Outer membrane lipoprotein-sorting protein n=1 Tax=Ancylomarina subtilis TaxID=1639035 RepID=A0A4V2FT12_9BACT|nr:outer membrane lipoprotein-sorting protein [Ancylomarina subtilis]RZT96365.1 outer membrane lipoprotein-sorting protein [Ancylomarina subtilis]
MKVVLKYTHTKWFILLFTCLMMNQALAQQDSLSAREILRIADEKMRGLSSEGEYSMTIVRPTWSRTVIMKSWSKGTEYSMIYITSPAREKGQVFLKREKDMWNWVPSIERLIKIPPSMMMQSWMGSDFTNDDLLKESSVLKDYNHVLSGEENIRGYDCYKLSLYPREDAAVVWGKLVMWISKEGYHRLKTEYYDEDQYLINEENLFDIRRMDDREIPTRMEMVPMDKKGNKTIFRFLNVKFDIDIKESFFSQQNMKRVR